MKKVITVTTEDMLIDLPPMEPPKITGKTIWHVGVSGGKDSSAALIWMVRESGIDPARIKATFCDIGNDHEWTIEHIQYLSEKVHPIETIKPEMQFFPLCAHKRRFPSTKARFCTEFLKIHPSWDHVVRMRYAGFEPIMVSGVRADESDERAKLLEWGMSDCSYQWRPLIRWTLDDVVSLHKKHGIHLNPLYSIGAQRVGCWPCIMSRKAEIRIIALKFPERIAEIRAWEKEINSTFYRPDMVPPRFRTKPWIKNGVQQLDDDGKPFMLCSIDDVVRWALTGKNAKGTYEDEPEPEHIGCRSGFCE